MCSTCGCDAEDSVKILLPGEELHPHHHDPENGHHHQHNHHSHPLTRDHTHEGSRIVNLEVDVLSKNNLMAERNRGYFEARNICCINLVSSPGSGKTTLLERTLTALKGKVNMAVIEGDQQTTNDADRIHKTGVPVVQVNTGKGCHLDSDMVHSAIMKLELKDNSILFIENVGNLVCPSLFDLGENHRVVIMSVTEGTDKPLKYPTMFETSDICIINKIDLGPYVDFDIEKSREYALRVNHHLDFFELSATRDEGMRAWYEWLKTLVPVEV